MNMNKNQNNGCLWKGEGLNRKGCQGTFGMMVLFFISIELRFTKLGAFIKTLLKVLKIFTFHYM